MVAQLDDNKVFVKELQQQVDSYREKFMKGEVSLDFCELVLIGII